MYDKTKFILASFSKIKHKKWELYCITRIINLLDDLDIEFRCQQPIRTSDGTKLADLFFPQINVYVEINESQHSSEKHKLSDKYRDRDIFEAIAAEKLEILTYNQNTNTDLSIKLLNLKIDETINKISKKIEGERNSRTFVSWDERIKLQFNYEHLTRLEVSKNIAVKRQFEAINLFGYNKKGCMRGEWRFPDRKKSIWFPRLFEHKEWTNILSPDGTIIQEKRSDNTIIKYTPNKNVRIVFGRYRDALGQVLYIYTGEFKYSHETNNGRVRFYKRVSKESLLLT